MLPQRQAEEVMVSGLNETEGDEREEDKGDESQLSLKTLLWHGGSVYDAWFSCASNQVYSFLLLYSITTRKSLKNPTHVWKWKYRLPRFC